MVDETYENDDKFDITYVVIVFVAMLPAVIVPAIVCQWILIGAVSIRHIAKLCSNSEASESAIGEELRICSCEVYLVQDLDRQRGGDCLETVDLLQIIS